MKGKEEFVDIIMPMYNAEAYVKNTVKSVISQTYRNWRLFIVDDCSTDNSFKVVVDLSKHDDRIIPIKADKNAGPAAARNLALERSKSRFIAFLDSDDLWTPNKLDRCLEILVKEKALLVCSAFLRRRGDKLIRPYLISPFKLLTKSRLIWSNWVYTSTVVVDKNIAGHFRMNTSVYYDDYLCWWSLLDKGKGYYLNETLTVYIEHEGSVSRNKLRSSIETWKLKRQYMRLGLFITLISSISYIVFGYLKVNGRHES
jgi:teichuronic acid biosynthesis glycosyltransferase TuaG